jgi:hypothetical protein
MSRVQDPRVQQAKEAAAALAAITNAQHGTETTESVLCGDYHGVDFVEDARMPTVYNGEWHCDFLLNEGTTGIMVVFSREDANEVACCYSLNTIDLLSTAMHLAHTNGGML